MSITNGYCTLAQLKARLEIADATDDTALEAVIEGASRWIDENRRRVFYTTDEARYYKPRFSDRLWIDDAVSVSKVEVATTTGLSYTEWSASDYVTIPYNETPIMQIAVDPGSAKFFVPKLLKSAKITAEYGYSDGAPAAIAQACILTSQYVWLRKDSPMGVAGFAAVGEIMISGIPRDIQDLLNSVPKRVAK